MALQYSVLHRTNNMTDIVTDLGATSYLLVYTGAAPATCATAASDVRDAEDVPGRAEVRSTSAVGGICPEGLTALALRTVSGFMSSSSSSSSSSLLRL